MSEVRLVLRDARRDISTTWHGSMADRVIAALAAEPETIEELETALERFYRPREEWSFFGCFCSGINDEPYDAGLVIVDLAARLIASESTYSSPSREGSVSYHDGHCATQVHLRYHLPADWTILYHVECWDVHAERKRRERAASPPYDARPVLYGRPLLDFLAAECLEAFRQAPIPPPASDVEPCYPGRRDHAEYDRVSGIHARWLLTPRDDLQGRSPREVLMAKHDFIDRDMQHRCEQWSMKGQCPRGLDRESHAYRFAGFGTHEIVTYYELVRHLLWSCRDRIAELASATPRVDLAVMGRGDFLTDEVPRLTNARDAWLDALEPNLSHRATPRQLIENERQRLPEGSSGRDMMIDPDCPLCAMMADSPGVGFWHLDGSGMDPDFAFSLHSTREEWEAEQREFEEMSRQFAEREAERKRLGVEQPGEGWQSPDSAWQRSFSAAKSNDQPLALRLFAIGSHLAELIVDLKRPTEERPLIDRLNRDWGNLREVAGSTDLSTAAALIEPVLDRFRETLNDVYDSRIDLSGKCIDLQSRLEEFLDPPREHDDPPAEFDDSDMPF